MFKLIESDMSCVQTCFLPVAWIMGTATADPTISNEDLQAVHDSHEQMQAAGGSDGLEGARLDLALDEIAEEISAVEEEQRGLDKKLREAIEYQESNDSVGRLRKDVDQKRRDHTRLLAIQQGLDAEKDRLNQPEEQPMMNDVASHER